MAIDPGSDSSRYTSVRCFCKELQYTKALDALPPFMDVDELATGAELPEAQTLRATALLALERYGEARVNLDAVLSVPLSPTQQGEAWLVNARLLERAGKVDDALLYARAAARLLTDKGEAEQAVKARIHSALLLSYKRCRDVAERELAMARELVPDDPEILVGEADVLALFDARADAKARFLAAREQGAARAGDIGYAWVATLAGDFDDAARALDRLSPLAAEDLPARRVRLLLQLARHRWDEAVMTLDEIGRTSPTSDLRRPDLLRRATLLYRMGCLDEARRAFEELAATAPAATDEEDPVKARAVRAARLLSRGDLEALPHQRLRAFPSLAQLHNHCGPSSCELYLRFFGLAGDAVEIARQIKFPDGGTPVYRMRRYLESAGLHARRVEADLPTLKRLIDAGVPVIMEEEYSSSNHVAVAMGYDDRREILEVQDPMSHEVRETPYEELDKLNDLANHGALVAVPAEVNGTPGEAVLDAAGATECRYIALVDEAAAALDGDRLDDAVRLLDESAALRRDYEMGWLVRYNLARRRVKGPNDAEGLERVREIVRETQAIWPDAEWPLQLAGGLLLDEGRYEEALAAWTVARDRDPDDGRNWAHIAECLLQLDRPAEADEAYAQALERDPGLVRANENRAQLTFDTERYTQAELFNECALSLAPLNPFNQEMRGRILRLQGDYAGALAAFERALELDSERDFAASQRGQLLTVIGRVDEGIAALEALWAKTPSLGVAVDLASVQYRNGSYQRAVEVCTAGLDKEESAGLLGLLGASQCALGQLDEGLVHLERATLLAPDYAWAFSEMGRHLAGAGHAVEALQAIAASVGASGGATPFEVDLGIAECDAGYAEQGVARLQRLVEGGQLDEDLLRRAAGGVIVLLRKGDGESAHALAEVLRQGVPEGAETNYLADLDALFEQAQTVTATEPAPRAIRGLAPAVPPKQAPPDFAPEHPTDAQRWALALAGILGRLNGERHDRLGGRARDLYEREASTHALAKWWNIDGPDAARSCLDWLADEGHRADLRALVTALSAEEPTAEQRAIIEDASEDRLRFAREHAASLGERGLLAWDLGRLVAVAGWAHLAGYLSDEEEAWARILPAARAVQAAHGSWREFGEHYLLGLEFAFGSTDDGSRQALTALLRDEQSPWRRLAWRTSLDATPTTEHVATG